MARVQASFSSLKTHFTVVCTVNKKTRQCTQPRLYPKWPQVWAEEHSEEPGSWVASGQSWPTQFPVSSPPPNTSHKHVSEKALHLCGGVRKEARRGDGERRQQISGIDEKHLQWKALRRALTLRGQAEASLQSVALLPMQHSVNVRAILDHICLTVCILKGRNSSEAPITSIFGFERC